MTVWVVWVAGGSNKGIWEKRFSFYSRLVVMFFSCHFYLFFQTHQDFFDVQNKTEVQCFIR